MPASTDSAVEMGLDLAEHRTSRSATHPRSGINSEEDDVFADRRAILEISKMADRMEILLKDSRRMTIEADQRLRAAEEELSFFFELEK